WGSAARTPTQPRPRTGTACRAPTRFKSAVTKRINEHRKTSGALVWQRNYWEHVIRDEKSLSQIAAYIANNPAQWELDSLHTGNKP
ncbi:MAG: transposase, partial [Bellilinea sp.]